MSLVPRNLFKQKPGKKGKNKPAPRLQPGSLLATYLLESYLLLNTHNPIPRDLRAVSAGLAPGFPVFLVVVLVLAWSMTSLSASL